MNLAKYIRIHTLTTYGPNNLNRDDLSRPKSATFGGTLRLRLSSQCVKRAWRVSDVMRDVVTGVRTRMFWVKTAQELQETYPLEALVAHIEPLRQALEGVKVGQKDDDGDSSQAGLPADDPAEESAALEKGKKAKKGKDTKSANPLETLKSKTLYFFSQSEMDFVRRTLADTLDPNGSTGGKPLAEKQAKTLVAELPMSADVALFGRMVAAAKDMSVDGAAQVGQQITVHKAAVEDDYFVAVDDLIGVDEAGTGHIGSNGFGAGTYYGYVAVDVHRLVKNLGGDVELAKKAVARLVEAVTTVSPSAKQNSFACHSPATYAMVEVGNGQPVALFNAFEAAVKGDNVAAAAIAALKERADCHARVYASQRVERVEFNVLTCEGTLEGVVTHALTAFGA